MVEALRQRFMNKARVVEELGAAADLDPITRGLALWIAGDLEESPYLAYFPLLGELEQTSATPERLAEIRRQLEALAASHPTVPSLRAGVAGAYEAAQKTLDGLPFEYEHLWQYRAIAAYHLGRKAEAADFVDRMYVRPRARAPIRDDVIPPRVQQQHDNAASLVLGPAAAAQRRDDFDAVVPIVKRLFAEPMTLEDVRRAIAADTSLADPLRVAALRTAERWPQDARKLNEASWREVSRPGGESDRYALGLRLAREAVRLEPQQGAFVNTLAAALYRCEDYRAALDALHRSDALNAAGDARWRLPADVALLAMTLWRLGCRDEAWAEFDALRHLMTLPDHAPDPENQHLFDEAAELIAGSSDEPR